MSDSLLLGRFAAVLVDMDGTILTSTAAAERAWSTWAQRHGIDLPSFLPTIHGVQASETIRRLGRSDLDPATEAAVVTQLELDDVQGVTEVRGARRFLSHVPSNRWAVVTSAPLALARRRMVAAGVPLPPLMVTAESVARSKPAPDGFLLAAERLGVSASRCLILEDSPAGIAAAEAAGGTVLQIRTGHLAPTARFVVADFSGLRVAQAADGLIEVTRTAE
jgi:sugar-phosphatase